jgi:hypothetical protein
VVSAPPEHPTMPVNKTTAKRLKKICFIRTSKGKRETCAKGKLILPKATSLYQGTARRLARLLAEPTLITIFAARELSRAGCIDIIDLVGL